MKSIYQSEVINMKALNNLFIEMTAKIVTSTANIVIWTFQDIKRSQILLILNW